MGAMRIDEIYASGDEPGLLLRVLPAEDRRGRGATSTARWPSCARWTRRSSRSPTAPAARRARKTIEIVTRIKRRVSASRRWRTSPASGATVDELRATLDEMRDAGIENVLALRGDPPQGEAEWTATEGGLDYSRELVELIRGELPTSRSARRASPRSTSTPTVGRGRPALPQGEGRRGRALPDHAAVLRQRALLRLRRARARDRHRRPDRARASCRSRTYDQITRITEHVRRDDPRPRLHDRARARAERRARWPTSASPTRRCSAPTCWPTARPASTSTRSTARRRRARSSARCASGAPGTRAHRPGRAGPPGDARLAQLDVELLGHRRRAVGALVAHVDLSSWR